MSVQCHRTNSGPEIGQWGQLRESDTGLRNVSFVSGFTQGCINGHSAAGGGGCCAPELGLMGVRSLTDDRRTFTGRFSMARVRFLKIPRYVTVAGLGQPGRRSSENARSPEGPMVPALCWEDSKNSNWNYPNCYYCY